MGQTNSDTLFKAAKRKNNILLKVIRWFCTGASITTHNKMAAVKKEHLSNIIKMKFTKEESYWNFCLQLFLAEVRLNVLDMCITKAIRMRVAEFDFLTANLDSGC